MDNSRTSSSTSRKHKKSRKKKNVKKQKQKCSRRDSKEFSIDLTQLSQTNKTTLMIRNIPNRYNKNTILRRITKNHKGKFDFFYLPIDFEKKCNMGYAFINFINTSYIKAFFNEFDGKTWEKFNSKKVFTK